MVTTSVQSASASTRADRSGRPNMFAKADSPRSLLPAPLALDGVAALYAVFAEQNRSDAKSAKTTVSLTSTERAVAREAERVALARAEKAQSEQGGLFDSMGLLSIVGVATGSPLLVLADMSMHMARLTPEVLRDFEKDHADTIEIGTKAYFAAVNGAVLAGDPLNPETVRAAIAIGGLIVEQTGVFGKDVSDWVGTGMMVGRGVDRSASATVVIADKDSAVSDTIRTVDRETVDYTKWVALAGMTVAAGGAVVFSGGAATPVIAIGIALSVGGFVAQETKCLDPLLGQDAARWTGVGLMVSGAVLTGVGAATVTAETAQVLMTTGQAIDGGAQVRTGMHQLQNAAILHAVDDAHGEARKFSNSAQRLQGDVDVLIDALRAGEKRHRRIAEVVNGAIQTESDTRLMSVGVMA